MQLYALTDPRTKSNSNMQVVYLSDAEVKDDRGALGVTGFMNATPLRTYAVTVRLCAA